MIASYSGIMYDVMVTIFVGVTALFGIYMIFVIRDLKRRRR